MLARHNKLQTKQPLIQIGSQPYQKTRLAELEEAIALKREAGLDEYFFNSYCRGCGGCCYNVAPYMGAEELERLVLLSPDNLNFDAAVRLYHYGDKTEIKALCKYYGIKYGQNEFLFNVPGSGITLVREPYSGTHNDKFLFYPLQKEGGACQLLDTKTHLCMTEKGKPEICRRAGCNEMKIDVPLLMRAGKMTQDELMGLAEKHGKRKALKMAGEMLSKII